MQGLTRVGSQLCSTLVGSDSLLLRACKAFPKTRRTTQKHEQVTKNQPSEIKKKTKFYEKLSEAKHQTVHGHSIAFRELVEITGEKPKNMNKKLKNQLLEIKKKIKLSEAKHQTVPGHSIEFTVTFRISRNYRRERETQKEKEKGERERSHWRRKQRNRSKPQKRNGGKSEEKEKTSTKQWD